MYPRKTLDIGWSDLAFSALACFRPGRRRDAAARVEAYWGSGSDDALATLSVRTAFDLLLGTLALPRGSEVLVSAVTIRDMVRIVEHHGLVAVPVDLDMDTLTVRRDALERAAGPKTRAILVAHLFGSRMPLDEVADFAGERGLLLFEDCAQAFAGDGYRGHPASTAVFFSFGPIKTRTALGGALTHVRDRDLLRRMRSAHDAWPVQTRSWFLRRTLKYAGIALALNPTGMRVVDGLARAAGTTHDDVLGRAVRGFAGASFFRRIRQQPSYPLLALLHRRLRTLGSGAYAARAQRGRLAAALLDGVHRPGVRAADHTHWVFPICPSDPDGLMRDLWRAGFDATRGASSLAPVAPAATRPGIDAPNARSAMRDVLYLPVHAGVPESELRRLCGIVVTHERTHAAHRAAARIRSAPSMGGSRA